MGFHDIAVKHMLDNLGSVSPIHGGCYIESDKVSDDEDDDDRKVIDKRNL